MSASATPTHTEIGVVYVAAVVQGLALVMFPAAGAIFTSAQGFGFDSTRYGAMFLPQVVFAVLASGLAPRLFANKCFSASLNPGALRIFRKTRAIFFSTE